LEEFKESMVQKSNIIIFRAEESKKTEPKERKVEDMNHNKWFSLSVCLCQNNTRHIIQEIIRA
jgi:hypothetical protein